MAATLLACPHLGSLMHAAMPQPDPGMQLQRGSVHAGPHRVDGGGVGGGLGLGDAAAPASAVVAAHGRMLEAQVGVCVCVCVCV